MKAGIAIRRIVFSVALGSLLGCAGTKNGGETFSTTTINFNSSEIGSVPSGFFTALTGDGGPVSWVIREDAGAPGGPRVLAQESAETNHYRFPLCVYRPIFARDVEASVDFKPVSGTVDEAGGIVLRYRPGNYYIARANALENNVILFKTVNGKRSKIEEVPAPVALGQWQTLGFEAQGTHLKITLNGHTVLERDDRTFLNAGRVGLWTKADSVSEFANFKIAPAR